MLLGRSQDWDWALLRLNSAPPPGVSFRGWDAEPVPVGADDRDLPPPVGRPQEVEPGHDVRGTSRSTSARRRAAPACSPASCGTTARPKAARRGGALTIFDRRRLLVRGGLLGGDALCSNPDGSDFFSQFGAMLPLVRQYLTPNDAGRGARRVGRVLPRQPQPLLHDDQPGGDRGPRQRHDRRLGAHRLPLPRVRRAGRGPQPGVPLLPQAGSSATRTSSRRTRRSAQAVAAATSRPTGCSRARRSTTCSCRTRRRARARRARSRSTGS